ncbi:metal-dependent hydrolase [Brevibacillus laterosporus]|uniref:metal-dependent hydrolase n=1 Tax=Brevibacillus laterosporus TaxID=1465 RepID=UPI00112A6F6E|nr:metal-dependent hydrolase [Brevibacillus laterosporus]MBG9790955.1 hypothetical protein [Brevibacillus laterosporus]MBG9804922.1 hypothetical protein [Brevibacillus laterosporus]MED1790571.1 metal-dependent hydrolase [Brevibacillus laterosporus]MED4762068.1 metal-dependent hydrolase [Brevibacillus laterosporus]TPH09930.1 metal-dependent hydrolase [Brevibacillus laterosporus]
MMGKTHSSVAIAAYCSCRLPNTLEEIPTWITEISIVYFTSLLPDIDEPRSKIGSILLPVIPSWLRPLAFIVLSIILIILGITKLNYLLIGLGLFILYLAMVKHRESITHSIVGLFSICAFLYLLNPTYLLPALIGYGSHILVLDFITEKVSLFSPFSNRRFGITLLRTNSFFEKLLFYRGSQICIVWLLILKYVLPKL